VAVRRRKCITCVGEVFGLFKKAIRPFEEESKERQREIHQREEKLRREKEREPVSGKLGVFGDLGL
jgi:Sec-independent protein translocase protein TatA